MKLSKRQLRNLIKEAYRGESWIGGMFPSDNLANQKTSEIKPINKYDFFGNISEWTSSIYTLPSSPFRTIMGTSCFDLQDKYLSIQYRKSNFAPQVLRDVGLRFMSQIRIK